MFIANEKPAYSPKTDDFDNFICCDNYIIKRKYYIHSDLCAQLVAHNIINNFKY